MLLRKNLAKIDLRSGLSFSVMLVATLLLAGCNTTKTASTSKSDIVYDVKIWNDGYRAGEDTFGLQIDKIIDTGNSTIIEFVGLERQKYKWGAIIGDQIFLQTADGSVKKMTSAEGLSKLEFKNHRYHVLPKDKFYIEFERVPPGTGFSLIARENGNDRSPLTFSGLFMGRQLLDKPQGNARNQAGWALDGKTGCKVWAPVAAWTPSWTGGCANGLANGKGHLEWRNGGSIAGSGDLTMQAGKLTGPGKYTWKDGSWYDGQWKEGLRQGTGTLVDGAGVRWSGQWNNDAIVSGSVRYPNGDSYEGRIINGEPVGETARNRSTPQERERIRSLMTQLVEDDATNWSFNRYDYGTLAFEKVRSRHPNGAVAVARLGYTYNGGARGWVDASYSANGSFACLQFHDIGGCRAPRARSTQSSGGAVTGSGGTQYICEYQCRAGGLTGEHTAKFTIRVNAPNEWTARNSIEDQTKKHCSGLRGDSFMFKNQTMYPTNERCEAAR